MSENNKCCIGWNELPMYAARCFRELFEQTGVYHPIIATRPTIPIQGMDKLLPDKIKWIDHKNVPTWASLGLPVPEVFLSPSWAYEPFNALAREVRRSGGRVDILVDNCWKGNIRQVLGAIYFRLYKVGFYSNIWVPGNSGKKLAELWGFSCESIFTGLYAVEPKLFNVYNRQLKLRPKRLIFVGQLIRRKGVQELVEAFNELSHKYCDWELHVYGEGVLRHVVEGPNVVYHGFQQPEVIARALEESRFLALPSREEHWGLVVCEAAQAGCGLVLSKFVGSAEDLATNKNAFICNSITVSEIKNGLSWAMQCNETELDTIESVSFRLGSRFNTRNWALIFKSMQMPRNSLITI